MLDGTLRKLLSNFLLLVTLAVAGCSSKQSDKVAPETENVSLFKEGKGVLLSTETRKLFELEIVEAEERAMPRRIHKTGQVYRAARQTTPASAMLLLTANERKQLSVGQLCNINGAGDIPGEINGTLIRLDTHAEAAFNQIEGLIQFADPDHRFRAGAFLRLTFTNRDSRPVLVVPQSALLIAADGAFVYTVNGAHLSRTRVKPGAISGGWVEIEDGLYAGDSVAAKGVENLWLVELSALKGGTPCCPVPKKEK